MSTIEQYMPVGRPMPAQKLRKWRQEMLWSQRRACEELGWARGALGPAEREDGAPKYIALAAGALMLDIPPYGSHDWYAWCTINKDVIDKLESIKQVKNREKRQHGKAK